MPIEELQHGRYKYLRRLGSGGMGEVYLMQDTRVNRQVAIKVLRTGGTPAEGTSSARLFEREARAIAALDHPNILPLYDFGEEELDGDGMTYMVMPYCADGSLETWLHQRDEGLLPAPQVAALIEQAAEGLQYAHEQKVIHLDVKPPNFLIRANRKEPLKPTLLLADFGISRNFTTVSSSSHTIRGTPAAMAPEQWSGEPVFASDQYALAVMAYEMLVGRPPFVGSMEQLMYRHFSAQPPVPSSFNPRLPQAVDVVLLRALSKKPEERYPTIAEFASELLVAASQPAEFSAEKLAGYSTLTITPSEAEAGLSRMLTLAGGEEVNVAIPPGIQNGQVLRLPHAGSEPGAPGVLLVNIAVQHPETPVPGASSLPLVADAGVLDAETTPSVKMRAEQASQKGASPETPRSIDAVPAASAHVAAARSDTPAQPLLLTPSEHDLPTLMSVGKVEAITSVPTPVARPRRRFGALALVSVLVVLLILAGSIFFYASRLIAASNVQPTPTHAVPTATPTPSPTPVPPGLYIAGTYNGSMADNATGQQMGLSVHIVQTNNSGALSGTVTFAPATTPYILKGIVNMQGAFTFSIAQPSGQLPLVFHGNHQAGDYLHGFYCRSSTGSCPSDAGYFTVGPRF